MLILRKGKEKVNEIETAVVRFYDKYKFVV
jgi:hypothetical protein